MAKIGELGQAVIGQTIKVHLPGESPWAECLAVYDDGTWEGRISNRLFAQMPAQERVAIAEPIWGKQDPLPSLHDYKQDMVVKFKRSVSQQHGYEIWVPTEAASGSA